jgi:protein-tyrosine phosphatase
MDEYGKGIGDIHCHLLPEVDDGSQSMEMTKQMLQSSWEQGVYYQFATPHNYPDITKEKIDQILATYQKVLAFVKEAYPQMQLILGNEVLYRSSVLEELKKGLILTLNHTPYILVEFYPAVEYSEIYSAVRTLLNHGYYPILAHTERYQNLHRNMDRYQELIDAGAYIQINTQSFMGGFLNRSSAFCIKLLQNEMVHFIGTDAHNLSTRPVFVQKCVEKLRNRVDECILDTVLHKNPMKIIKNEII